MASHAALQYLPEVVRHEQTGCAHFSSFMGVIIISPSRGTGADDPSGNISRGGGSVSVQKETHYDLGCQAAAT